LINRQEKKYKFGYQMRIYLIILPILLFISAACAPRTICPANLAPPTVEELSNRKTQQEADISRSIAFLGVAHKVIDTEELEQAGVSHGYLIFRVAHDSSADRAGLQSGDIILEFDGISLDSIAEQERTQYLRHYIREGKRIGDRLCLKILRRTSDIKAKSSKVTMQPKSLKALKELLDNQLPDQKLLVTIDNKTHILHFDTVLGERKNQQIEALPTNQELYPEYEELQPPYNVLTERLVEHFGLQEQFQDIIERYNEDELWDNGFRLNLFRYLHRDPLKLIPVIENRTEQIHRLSETADLAGLLHEGTGWLDESAVFVRQGIPLSSDKQTHMDYIKEVLERSLAYREQAFVQLSPDEIAFLEEQLPILMHRFAHSYYIDRPNDPDDKTTNLEIIELAKKVDYQNLFMAGLVLAQLTDEQWLSNFKQIMLARPAPISEDINGVSGDILYYGVTKAGPVIVGGPGRNIYKVPAAAIIDLGGDDLYLGRAGLVDEDQRIATTIDLEGNDEYMATEQYAQGCAILGAGLLADMQGDDLYVGTKFSQGCAVIGSGMLADLRGNDQYIGEEFNQGVAFWGTAILLDAQGNDRYQSNMYAQGVGGTKGFGALIDNTGDDYYFAGGRDKSSYGTPGIFKGSSQGLGIGFRGYSSGGIGLLLDGNGDDNFWAGNFSQGTGYYFGLGIIRNFGKGDDTYTASRYGQGSSAHSAAGILIDDDGNDRYDGYHIALQGAAWDLGMAALVDRSGNDVYKRGVDGFTQAASSHNGLAVFVDNAGIDRYMGEQARAERNDYHGGASLSVFIDAGGDQDVYSNGANNATTCGGVYGIRADLGDDVNAVLKDDNYLQGRAICDKDLSLPK
jgi:hypothetical protein